MLKLGGPLEPQGLLTQRPAAPISPAKDPQLSPAAQNSQSANQDTLQAQCALMTSVENQGQSPIQQQEPAAQSGVQKNTPECLQTAVDHEQLGKTEEKAQMK